MHLHNDQLVALSKLVETLDDFETAQALHIGDGGAIFEDDEIVGYIVRVEIDGGGWVHGVRFDD